MKQSLSILLFLMLFLFCTQKKNKLNSISKNQQYIISNYNKIEDFLKTNPDTINTIFSDLELKSRTEPASFQAMSQIGLGIFYANKSQGELAIKHFKKVLHLLQKKPDDSLTARANAGIGNYYKNSGDFQKSFQYLFKALKIFEKNKNKTGIALTHNNIAQVYTQKNDLVEAKKHLLIALEVLEKDKSNFAYLAAAHSMANLFGMSGDFESALKIDNECLKITQSQKAITAEVQFLDNKANCFLYSNQLDSAQYYFEKCLEKDLKIGSQKNIADSYNNLAEFYRQKKDFRNAENQITNSINILKSINYTSNLLKAYQTQKDIFESQQKFELAVLAQKNYIAVYKKLMNDKQEAATSEFKVVYQTAKKEKLLLEKDIQAKQKNTTILILSILALFVAVLGFLFYRQQKLKVRQQKQEYKLKKAIAQIETQNKLHAQRINISRDLHDNIGSQLTFIISSVDNIKYGFDITNPKLDFKLSSISEFAKSTILELRDTIWAMNNNEIKFEDLKSRIFNFIEKAKLATENIEFIFEVDEVLTEKTFTSIEGMNLYRTIQEAVNNSVKYANPSQIVIKVQLLSGGIEMIIQDNGQGFDTETVENGNGIKNMHKRIEEIGGKFVLLSTQKGTKIQIFIQI